jgi:hypothetical protein
MQQFVLKVHQNMSCDLPSGFSVEGKTKRADRKMGFEQHGCPVGRRCRHLRAASHPSASLALEFKAKVFARSLGI